MNKTSQLNYHIISPHLGCWNHYICELGQLVLWIAYGFVKRRSKYSDNSGSGVACPAYATAFCIDCQSLEHVRNLGAAEIKAIPHPDFAPRRTRLRLCRSCTAGSPILRHDQQPHFVATCGAQSQIFHRRFIDHYRQTIVVTVRPQV
jgi:hypothetical protein